MLKKKSQLGKTVRFPNHIRKKQTNKQKQKIPTIVSKSLRFQTITLVKYIVSKIMIFQKFTKFTKRKICMISKFYIKVNRY